MAREGRAGVIRSSLSGAHIRYTKYPKRFWESPVDVLQAALGACRAGEGAADCGQWVDLRGVFLSFCCGDSARLHQHQVSASAESARAQAATLFVYDSRESDRRQKCRKRFNIYNERGIFLLFIKCGLIN